VSRHLVKPSLGPPESLTIHPYRASGVSEGDHPSESRKLAERIGRESGYGR